MPDTPMTPDEFRDEMRKIYPIDGECDEEIAHGNADELMCKLLTQFGYGEGVKIFNDATKWYA